MVGFDAPHITHDMILRFMGMNFSAITAGSARIPSTVGKDVKPLPALLEATPSASPSPAKTPEQDKAMWEGVYLCFSRLLSLLSDALYVQHTTTPARPPSCSFSSLFSWACGSGGAREGHVYVACPCRQTKRTYPLVLTWKNRMGMVQTTSGANGSNHERGKSGLRSLRPSRPFSVLEMKRTKKIAVPGYE